MQNLIKTTFHHLQRHTTQRIKDFVRFKTLKLRSPKFHTLCKHLETLSSYNGCIACGSKENIEWHHVDVEFHVDPSRELDPTNLVPLCMNRHTNETLHKHHFTIGHGGKNWKTLNPNCRNDAKKILDSLTPLK